MCDGSDQKTLCEDVDQSESVRSMAHKLCFATHFLYFISPLPLSGVHYMCTLNIYIFFICKPKPTRFFALLSSLCCIIIVR